MSGPDHAVLDTGKALLLLAFAVEALERGTAVGRRLDHGALPAWRTVVRGEGALCAPKGCP